MAGRRLPDFSIEKSGNRSPSTRVPDRSSRRSFEFDYDYDREQEQEENALTTGHHLEQHAAKVFRLRQRRQNGMIERLFEMAQPSRRAARIDERVCHHLFENLRPDVMRTGKGGEHSVRRKQIEGAHMQFSIAAQSVVQSAFGFREGRRIENDEIE